MTDSGASDRSPDFSPDGRTLLFVSDRTNDNNDIWRVGVNGSGLKRLTTREDDESSPDWSHDGRKIVYSGYHYASYELYTMRADGTGKKVIANDLSDDVQPRWSPDGRSIVFVRTCQVPEICMKHATNRVDALGELYVVGANGGKQRRLKKTSAVESDPRWSSNSKSIAFVSAVGQNSDIAVVNANGTGLKRLTRATAVDLDPRWSPDGRKIAYTVNDLRTLTEEAYVVSATGGKPVDLVPGPSQEDDPAWRPR